MGDGYIAGSAGSGTTNEVLEVANYYKVAEQSWKDAGKPGRPRFVAALTCAVGAERTRESMRSYYAFRGEAAKKMELPIPYTEQALLDAMDAFEQSGVDELILEPGIGDLDQVDQLAEIIATR